jgi:hypothetical protein
MKIDCRGLRARRGRKFLVGAGQPDLPRVRVERRRGRWRRPDTAIVVGAGQPDLPRVRVESRRGVRSGMSVGQHHSYPEISWHPRYCGTQQPGNHDISGS